MILLKNWSNNILISICKLSDLQFLLVALISSLILGVIFSYLIINLLVLALWSISGFPDLGLAGIGLLPIILFFLIFLSCGFAVIIFTLLKRARGNFLNRD